VCDRSIDRVAHRDRDRHVADDGAVCSRRVIRKPPGRIDGGARGTESHGTEQKTAGAHGAVRLTATPMPCAAGERGPAVEEEETPAPSPTASWRWAEAWLGLGVGHPTERVQQGARADLRCDAAGLRGRMADACACLPPVVGLAAPFLGRVGLQWERAGCGSRSHR
jgi:hypothetical protein